jgi:hypothetical protein
VTTADPLDELYARITWQSLDANVSISARILRVELPDDFVVVFTPAFPLRGNSFPVIVTRTHHGNGKSGFTFIYEKGAWTGEAGQLLSDNAIRRCLTLEGPIAVN